MTLAEKIEQRGRLKGLEEGRTALIVKQIRRRFGELPPVIEHRLRQSDLDMLDKFGESLLDFKDLQDAEKWWDEHGKEGHA